MGIGFDFGTTNSSIAIATPDGTVQVARFADIAGFTDSFRSLLYLERIREARRSIIESWAGPEGIAHYLRGEEKGRLIQSLKSFLASRSLESTEIFGRRFKLKELVANVPCCASVRPFDPKAKGELYLAIAGSPSPVILSMQRSFAIWSHRLLGRARNSIQPASAARPYLDLLQIGALASSFFLAAYGNSQHATKRCWPIARTGEVECSVISR